MKDNRELQLNPRTDMKSRDVEETKGCGTPFQVGRAVLSAPAAAGSGVPALPLGNGARTSVRRNAGTGAPCGLKSALLGGADRPCHPAQAGAPGLAMFALALLFLPYADAQVTSLYWTIGAPIPDGSAVGMANSQVVNDSGLTIGSLRVTLEITGRLGAASNGDLYATLVHDTGFAVLLNRPGRRAGVPLGYGDDGLSVTFEDGSGAADIHGYRFTLFGNHTTPVGGPLSGTWATDGRTADPDEVLDTSLQTATLSQFEGLNPQGTWTLFVADLETGNLATLTGWGLEITPVPEPGAWAVGLAAGGLLCALLNRRGRRRL